MKKKQRIGVVVNNKLKKTRSVIVQMRYQHPKYLKTITRTTKYLVHDELNQSNIGDIVLLEEIRPISKLKRWTLKEIIQAYKE